MGHKLLKMEKLYSYAYLGCVILLGFTFFSSGMGKLYAEHSFLSFIGPVWLADQLYEYNLKLYAQFIGYSQVTIGFMLLTFRFRTLGAIMLVPMVANILMITISLEWRGTPYIVGILLAMNLYLLWYDRSQLLHLLTGHRSERLEMKPLLRSGSLLWILAYLLTLLSIQVSFYSLILAWILTATAVLAGVFSEKLGSLLVNFKVKMAN